MKAPEATLFVTVQARVAEARVRVNALDVSDEVKRSALRRLASLEKASHTDLSIASREVESFHADLDAGEVPIYG